MPTISITTRRRKDGYRYVVRYRLGGRATPLVHAGTFTYPHDAEARAYRLRSMIEQGIAPTRADRA